MRYNHNFEIGYLQLFQINAETMLIDISIITVIIIIFNIIIIVIIADVRHITCRRNRFSGS